MSNTKPGQGGAPSISNGGLPIRYTKSGTNADVDAPTVEYTAQTVAGDALLAVAETHGEGESRRAAVWLSAWAESTERIARHARAREERCHAGMLDARAAGDRRWEAWEMGEWAKEAASAHRREREAAYAWQYAARLACYGWGDATLQDALRAAHIRHEAAAGDSAAAGGTTPAEGSGGAGGGSRSGADGGVGAGFGGHAPMAHGGPSPEGGGAAGAERGEGGRGTGDAGSVAPIWAGGDRYTSADDLRTARGWDLSDEWSAMSGGVRTLDPADLEPVAEARPGRRGVR